MSRPEIDRAAEVVEHLERLLPQLRNSEPNSPERTNLIEEVRKYNNSYKRLTGKHYSPPEREED
ncbi:hypothetical protein FJZ22_00305 [Candidatus Pacearchaeota archaeon]|nr:hypothetical protein [Candidatus Pacearchaeota archaeon]